MMSDEKFNETLLKKIKDQKIKPVPKWRFSLRNILIWFFGFLSLLLGAMSVSLIIYLQQFDELAMYQQMDARTLDLIAVMVPLFWFISFMIFLLAIYFNVKKTERGYRYRPIYILAASLILSVLLGAMFHLVGLGEQMDDWLSERAPYYDRVMSPHLHYWSNPERGRLIGMVSSETVDDNFTLMSVDQGEWQVFFESNKDEPVPVIKQGAPVRCLGTKIAERKFIARQILPVVLGKKFFNRAEAPCAMKKMGKPGACTQAERILTVSRLKVLIAQNLLANKEEVKEIVKTDPRAMMELNALQLDRETMSKILE